MLTRLEFHIENCESEAEQFGSHYETDREVIDGKECDIIFNVVDTMHHMWSETLKDSPERFHPLAYIAEIQPGVYQTSDVNFHNDIDSLTDFEESRNYSLINGLLHPDEETHYSQYGVAADLDEVLEHFNGIMDSEIPFVISYSYIYKKHQSSDGGWRWCKWGPNISKKLTPTAEYLYDEEDIDKVLIFHLYVLEPKKAQA